MKSRRTWLMTIAACGVCPMAAGLAMAADAYPDRPVTIVVPSVAGGAADAVARTVAQGLAKRLDAPVVVHRMSPSRRRMAIRCSSDWTPRLRPPPT